MGCPVIFASGNSHLSGYSIAFPAWLPQTLAVGASAYSYYAQGEWRFLWSQSGSGLDLLAPSSDPCWLGQIWSLDQEDGTGENPLRDTNLCQAYYPNPVIWDCDDAGYNDQDYTCKFGGTSAAAPIVAGTAALILSKDSSLTAPEVYDILRGSASRFFIENEEVIEITPPDTTYGYGRVDAFRAILSLSHGDVNNNGIVDIADLTVLVNFFYKQGPVPFPSDRIADTDCNGGLDPSDVTYMVNFMFKSGPPPPSPCFEF